MSSAILRSSFAASVRTTFSKSQRTTTTTKRSVMTKAVRKHRREKRHLFSHVHTITFTMKKGFFFLVTKSCDRSVCLSSLQLTLCCLSFQTHNAYPSRTHTHTQVTITEGVGTLFFVFSFFLFFPGKFYNSGSCYYYCCCCCCCLLRVIASLSS